MGENEINVINYAFIGNFENVTCANDLIVVDSKDFKIKINGADRDITHCVISKKWLENFKNLENGKAIFEKFYKIFSDLLNAKNTTQSVEEKPKPTTIDVANGDIWFVIKDDGSTPNSQVLPQQVITYTQSAKILNKQQGLNKIKKHCPMLKQKEQKEQQDRKMAYEAKQAEQNQLKETIKSQFKVLGTNALGDKVNKFVAEIFLTFSWNMLEWPHYGGEKCREIAKALQQNNMKDQWDKWLCQQFEAEAMISIIDNSGMKENEELLNRISRWYVGEWNDIILKGNFDKKISDYIASKLFEKFKETHSDKFTQNSTGGQNPEQTNVQIIGSSQTKPINIREGPQIKVDANNVHHKFRRWKNQKYVNEENVQVEVDDKNVHHRILRYKNKKTVGKADVRHRFGKWKNKN